MTTQQTVDEITHLLHHSLALTLDLERRHKRPTLKQASRNILRDAVDVLDPDLNNRGNRLPLPAETVAERLLEAAEDADAGDGRHGDLYRLAAVVVRSVAP